MTYRPGSQRRPFSIWAAIASLTVFAVAAVARPDESGVRWDEAAARHLLSRTSFGGTPEQARKLASMPLEKAVDALLDDATSAEAPPQPEWIREVWVNGWRRYADMSREEYLILFRRTYARNIDELNDLKAWWLRHMVTTKAPLANK
ncbi:MAG: DUF1800 family protein [Gemmataceae bacterium]